MTLQLELPIPLIDCDHCEGDGYCPCLECHDNYLTCVYCVAGKIGWERYDLSSPQWVEDLAGYEK